MNRYLIYCCVGSGGMFLTSVFARLLNYDVEPVISERGHCHRLGSSGIWSNTQDVNFIGEFWLNFRPDKKLFYTHVLDIDQFKTDYPDVKLVLIDFALDDIMLISKLFVCKAWPDIWSKEEYNKWAGPSWPAYSVDNILQSELVRNEIISDLARTRIKPWLNQVKRDEFDYTINFKTVIGLELPTLDEKLTEILNCYVPDNVNHYIKQYQQLNQTLYINE